MLSSVAVLLNPWRNEDDDHDWHHDDDDDDDSCNLWICACDENGSRKTSALKYEIIIFVHYVKSNDCHEASCLEVVKYL